MKTSDLEGPALDYWVARGLHEFIREIHFTDSGETLSIRGNDRGKPWDAALLCRRLHGRRRRVVLERACRLEMSDHGRGEVICTATFGKEGESVEGRGASLRIALLRAFVRHAFGDPSTTIFCAARRPCSACERRRSGSKVRSCRRRTCRRRTDVSAISGPRRGNERTRVKTKRAFRMEGPSKGGAAGRIRTHDPLVRSQVLYPTELQPHAKRYCFVITALWLNARIDSAIPEGNDSKKWCGWQEFEPTTPWFVAKYSIQLSYSRTQKRDYRQAYLKKEGAGSHFCGVSFTSCYA